MILYQGIWQEKDKAGEEEPSPSYTCEWYCSSSWMMWPSYGKEIWCQVFHL